MLKHFPGPEVREEIHAAIGRYAAIDWDPGATVNDLTNMWNRQDMMTLISDILDSYSITRLHVRNYEVRKVRPAFNFKYPVIIIEAPDGSYKNCPVCNSEDDRYLSGEAPVIKTWCMQCSCIYRKEVPGEAVNEGG